MICMFAAMEVQIATKFEILFFLNRLYFRQSGQCGYSSKCALIKEMHQKLSLFFWTGSTRSATVSFFLSFFFLYKQYCSFLLFLEEKSFVSIFPWISCSSLPDVSALTYNMERKLPKIAQVVLSSRLCLWVSLFINRKVLRNKLGEILVDGLQRC